MQVAQGHIECGSTPHFQGACIPQDSACGRSSLAHVVRPHPGRQQALMRIPPAQPIKVPEAYVLGGRVNERHALGMLVAI